jgi:hypothetical protein
MACLNEAFAIFLTVITLQRPALPLNFLTTFQCDSAGCASDKHHLEFFPEHVGHRREHTHLQQVRGTRGIGWNPCEAARPRPVAPLLRQWV